MNNMVFRQKWVTKPLIEVATLQRGFDLPVQDRTDGPHPIFAANGTVGFHGIAKCKGPGVVTGRSGTIGKVHYVENDYWPLNTSLYVKNFHGNDPKWVYYMLQSFGLERFSQGAGVPTLNRNLVHGESIRVPALPDQRRIAAILDQADALRAQRREALSQLDRLAQSIFVEMFGDPDLADTTTNFELLGSHLKFLTSGGRGWAEYYSDSGNRFVRSFDVQMNRIGADDKVFVTPPQNAEAKRTRVSSGDVLLTITGSLIGRVATAPTELDGAYISQHVAILRVNRTVFEPEFLSYFISLETGGQRQIAKSQYGQTKPGLNFDQIRAFRVPVPDMNSQRAFLIRIRKIQELRQTGLSALGEADCLFSSLQHRAFC
jgi:type I restriction enzyme S subunit